MKLPRIFCRGLCVLVLLACAGTTIAADKEELETLRETTLRLIQLMVDQGMMTQEKANELIQEAKLAAEKNAAEKSAAEKVAPEQKEVKAADTPKGKDGKATNVIRVPLVPETVKEEIREQIKQEVLTQAKAERWGEPGANPEWLDRIKIDGDLRLRMQADRFDKSNTSAENLSVEGINVKNTTKDRFRMRIRGRIGLQAKLNDKFGAVFRLATGSADDPVSTNATQGNYGNRYTVAIDRAYLYYQPKPWIRIAGGRMPNPWLHTDLVWDEDLNFDGLYVNLRKNFFKDKFTGFMTAGIFPIQDIESSGTNQAKSKWLYGMQAGVEWVKSEKASFKIGLGLYDFKNIEGRLNGDQLTAQNDTAPQFRQKGNTLIDIDPSPTSERWALASKFREVNLTATADFNVFDPYHVLVALDYVKNIGFDKSDITARTKSDFEEKTTGFQARVTYGIPQVEKRFDWNAYFGYKYLERDAVVDAFTESDFRLGGTDSKGYYLGGNYGLDKNVWLSAKWLSADVIDGRKFSVDVLQVDLNARF